MNKNSFFHKLSAFILVGAAVLLSGALRTAAPVSAAETDDAGQSNWSEPVLLDKGELTGDGRYSLRDVLYAMKIAVGVIDVEQDVYYRADVNSDGVVDTADWMLYLQAAAGKYTNFGYEKPAEDNVLFVDSGSYSLGDYCFRTVREALAYISQNPPTCEEERITLRFAPGVYRENTVFNIPYLTFEAMYPDAEELPNLTFYYGCGQTYASLNNANVGASNAASTYVLAGAHDFIARNIRFENSYNLYITEEERTDYTGDMAAFERRELYMDNPSTNMVANTTTQALALRVDADRCQFLNCQIIGRQDTLLMHNYNRVYMKDCYIEGTVDFIYGNATAVFDGCTINVPYHTGHVTAASTNSNQPYGYLFTNCSLTKNATTVKPAPEDGAVDLGRAWHGFAMVTYVNCKMDSHIAVKQPEGSKDYDRFENFNDTEYPREQCRYAEYGTMDINGNPYDLEAILPDYEKVLTKEEAETSYSPYLYLAARYNASKGALDEADGWNPGGYPEVDSSYTLSGMKTSE